MTDSPPSYTPCDIDLLDLIVKGLSSQDAQDIRDSFGIRGYTLVGSMAIVDNQQHVGDADVVLLCSRGPNRADRSGLLR